MRKGIFFSLFFAFWALSATSSVNAEPKAGSSVVPIPKGCDIAKSSDWEASINAMPGTKPLKIGVTGKIAFSRLGYKAILVHKVTDFHPRKLTLHLEITPPPGPSGEVHGVDQTVEGSFEVSTRDMLDVTIHCGEGVLAKITDIKLLD